jgi:hypothetical protein
MERLGADPFWHLTREYFMALRESIGPYLHLCVVEVDGDLAAAGLLTEAGGVVEYHLAGTATQYIETSPSKLIVDFARTWARERGNHVMHLAGSLGKGDSLHHFKVGFSPLRHPVSSWRAIIDVEEYGHLVERWEMLNGLAADTPDGYFPAYRKPS